MEEISGCWQTCQRIWLAPSLNSWALMTEWSWWCSAMHGGTWLLQGWYQLQWIFKNAKMQWLKGWQHGLLEEGRTIRLPQASVCWSSSTQLRRKKPHWKIWSFQVCPENSRISDGPWFGPCCIVQARDHVSRHQRDQRSESFCQATSLGSRSWWLWGVPSYTNEACQKLD